MTLVLRYTCACNWSCSSGTSASADRYTYVPLIGPFLIAAWGIPDLLGRWRHQQLSLILSASTVLLLFGIRTWDQVGYWKNSVKLFLHTAAITHENYIAYRSLGDALVKLEKMEDALKVYSEAVRIKPYYAGAHNNLGYTFLKLGRVEEAVEHYTQSLNLMPRSEETHTGLGLALYKMGRVNEAVQHYEEALRINPEYDTARYYLETARNESAIKS